MWQGILPLIRKHINISLRHQRHNTTEQRYSMSDDAFGNRAHQRFLDLPLLTALSLVALDRNLKQNGYMIHVMPDFGWGFNLDFGWGFNLDFGWGSYGDPMVIIWGIVLGIVLGIVWGLYWGLYGDCIGDCMVII
jgi:hypothetical protein